MHALGYLRPRRAIRWVVLLAITWLIWAFFNPSESATPRTSGVRKKAATARPTVIKTPVDWVGPQPVRVYGHTSAEEWESRANAVKKAMKHALFHYQRLASGYDEVRPVSGGFVNNHNGWRVTTIDSLDTMWIMGLRDEFNSSLSFVESMKFNMDSESYGSFFETVIRYMGGLLSAYALSGEPILLERADDLGALLLPAFNTTHGLAQAQINTQTGEIKQGWMEGGVFLAEFLSCQVEYKYLSYLTRKSEYFEKVQVAMDVMQNSKPGQKTGLFPIIWGHTTGIPIQEKVSVGSSADSAYEYMLKQYLLSSKSESKSLEMYLKSTNSVIEKMLYVSPKRKLLYVTELTSAGKGGLPTHIFEHLSCFYGGLLALGVHTLKDELTPTERERHQWAAEGLTYTCYTTYRDQSSGLAPDKIKWTQGWRKSERWVDSLARWENKGRKGPPPGVAMKAVPAKEGKRDYTTLKPAYLLRPETVESIYTLWRTTGDVVWRERGWDIAEAIFDRTWAHYGYASLRDVDVPQSNRGSLDEMPSYFMAETLKYLFLLFTDEDVVPLDKWVFNTEGHPFPTFEWNEREKKAYGIS